jgi:hypothetical protein
MTPALAAERETYARETNQLVARREEVRPQLEVTRDNLMTLRQAFYDYGRSGPTTGLRVQAARIIQGVTGIQIDPRLPAAELIQSLQNFMAPAMRIAGSGSSSDRDVQIFFGAIPTLANSPQGNVAIVDNMLDRVNYQLAALDHAAQYAARNGGSVDANYIIERSRFANQWAQRGRSEYWRQYWDAVQRGVPRPPPPNPAQWGAPPPPNRGGVGSGRPPAPPPAPGQARGGHIKRNPFTDERRRRRGIPVPSGD